MHPLIRLLRPRQWTKNGFCLAGLIFSGQYAYTASIGMAVATFFAFCAASSAVYVFNDIKDAKFDRLHPTKRHRPIAAGQVKAGLAMIMGVVLFCISIGISLLIGFKVLLCIALYFLLQFFYTLLFKQMALLDVCCIASGFVLRLLAGIYAVTMEPTAWITLCTFFLTLFLALLKRRTELAKQHQSDNQQRPALGGYSLPLLDSLINCTSMMVVTSYALFSAISGKNPTLIVTVPIVYYAIMHYQMAIVNSRYGEEPESILLHDRVLQAAIVLWLVVYLGITHSGVRLFQ